MLKRLALSCAVVTSVLAAPVALATPLFKINEGVIPDVGSPPVRTADKLNGSYDELLTIFAPGNFATQAYGDFTALVNGPSSVNSRLGGVFDSVGYTGDSTSGDPFDKVLYRLFFTFEATGFLTGPGQFSGGSGTFKIWADVERNTKSTFGATGANALSLANDGDDILLASATNVVYGTGNVVNPGAYEIVWNDFTLTTTGESYFIDPIPFYMNVLVDGDFDQFSPNILGHVLGTQVNYSVRGDVSAVFVPEPGSLALAGLALVGLAASRRRKA